MKRFILVVVFAVVGAAPAYADDFSVLLDEAKDAAYSAEQLITCDTPDGIRDALIEMEQRGGEIRYGDRGEDSGFWSGYGGWVGPRGSTAIKSDEDESLAVGTPADDQADTYVLDDGEETTYLGRKATQYRLSSGDVLRAGLIVDDETGVFLSVVTYDADGDQYCERRFVSFDPSAPDWDSAQPTESNLIESSEGSGFPGDLGAFDLVDYFTDDTDISFAYYSDGFFSFAAFRSPVEINATNPVAVQVEGHNYSREYTPGQVTYTWTVTTGGMAVIGDIPPDMHESVLSGLDRPADPGFFRRLWRSLFG